MSAARRSTLLAALGLILASSGLAQPPGSQRRPGARPRDDAHRMVEAYIVSNLQESVGLTDEEFVKALPLVKRLLGERRDIAERRRAALRDMRQMLQSGTAPEGRVVDRLREVKALEAEEADETRRNLEALDAVLTPLQQAKFRVMQIEVEQKIREILQQVRQRRRGDPPDLPEP